MVMALATTWLCTAAAMAGWSVLPIVAGWHPYVIVSGSMAPRIKPGDVVCVDPSALSRLARGQVVVVHDPAHPGRLLAHRVLDIRPDGSLVTKGDANPVPDSTHVPPGGAVGVVRLVVPSIGRLTLARSQPGFEEFGLIGITALAALLLAVLRSDGPARGGRASGRARPAPVAGPVRLPVSSSAPVSSVVPLSLLSSEVPVSLKDVLLPVGPVPPRDPALLAGALSGAALPASAIPASAVLPSRVPRGRRSALVRSIRRRPTWGPVVPEVVAATPTRRRAARAR
jgi:signal peptidase I